MCDHASRSKQICKRIAWSDRGTLLTRRAVGDVSLDGKVRGIVEGASVYACKSWLLG